VGHGRNSLDERIDACSVMLGDDDLVVCEVSGLIWISPPSSGKRRHHDASATVCLTDLDLGCSERSHIVCSGGEIRR